MPFDRSLIKIIGDEDGTGPWRWNPEPVYGNGPMQPPTVPGTKQTLNGVFILVSETLVNILKAGLTQAQKDELQQWVTVLNTEDPDPLKQPQTWHVPVWAGQQEAFYVRVPNSIWSDPTTNPPAKVKNYFQNLWREATN